MKKEYVKPVIESEEFVANEYVAACWYIYCNEGHTMIYAGVNEPRFDTSREDNDSFVWQLTANGVVRAWYREDGEHTNWSGGKYHILSEEPELKSNGNGPNAS